MRGSGKCGVGECNFHFPLGKVAYSTITVSRAGWRNKVRGSVHTQGDAEAQEKRSFHGEALLQTEADLVFLRLLHHEKARENKVPTPHQCPISSHIRTLAHTPRRQTDRQKFFSHDKIQVSLQCSTYNYELSTQLKELRDFSYIMDFVKLIFLTNQEIKSCHVSDMTTPLFELTN